VSIKALPESWILNPLLPHLPPTSLLTPFPVSCHLAPALPHLPPANYLLLNNIPAVNA
jgi:hypothetical protein